MVQLVVDVTPAWPFRIGSGSADGLFKARPGVLRRLIHIERVPVDCAVVQTSSQNVRFITQSAVERSAEIAIECMRFATGVDDDLSDFFQRFRSDKYIGPALRRYPYLRVRRRPTPWEALAWGVTEQLIEYREAVQIQRRMIDRFGVRCERSGLKDSPAPERLAGLAPVQLQACGLSELRALALRRLARSVSTGKLCLDRPNPEAGWRQLMRIPGIGAWTVEMLALYGQGRYDQIPAADLGYLKLVGRITTGNPQARADEDEVRGFFSRYREWRGLAGEYLRWAHGRGLIS